MDARGSQVPCLFRRRRMALASLLVILSVSASPSRHAEAARSVAQPDLEDLVTIAGSLPPAARPERDRGPVEPDAVIEGITFPLRLKPGTEVELARLFAEQQDPDSPNYHRWLTPEEFGRRFGLSDANVQEVVEWLSAQGFRIDEIARGRGWIRFSGTAREVEEAFRTTMRKFESRGELRQSNATEIALPDRIARLLAGPVPLNSFHSRPMHVRFPQSPARAGAEVEEAVPLYNNPSGAHFLAPADFATIYNVAPLHAAGITGTGVKIAVAARTNIHLSDVQLFRSQFGLPANDPHLIINGTDPGIVNKDEEGEAELDAEWSGAVAPGAEIDLVITADTDTTDGIMASAQYVIDNNSAQLITVSFGLCEQFPQTLAFNGLWNQAAAQGISVLVASGDSGVADCDDDPKQTMATHGASVNGICSTPWSICVGGTQFLDTDNPAAYWAATNDPVTRGSALSSIPEATWNESGGPCGALCASGGGASAIYPKPSWQVALGVPADNHRYVPDVSVAGATHDAYLTIVNGMTSGFTGFGGTSVSSPAMTGILALVVQRFGAQGNPNPRLYQIGAAQYSGIGPAVFRDITQGNNSVPGATGFAAGPGYDETTGLGSLDANSLVAHWAAPPPPSAPRSLPVRVNSGRRAARVRSFH